MAEDGPSSTATLRMKPKRKTEHPPALKVELVRRDPGWKQAGIGGAILTKAAQAAFRAGLEAAGIAAAGMYSTTLLLTDDADMRALNRQWRGKDKPTNVLSFPSGEDLESPTAARLEQPIFLGDIALALGTLRREAEAEAKPAAEHAAHLVVHGTLHLLSFDHEDEAGAAEMESLETEILRTLGIADPYREPAAALAGEVR